MAFNHLKFAFRRIWRSKVYNFIILLSLTVGFACSNLLISFLIAENNTDSFHTKKDRIFQVFADDPFGGNKPIAWTLGAVPEYLESNYPETEKVSLVVKADNISLETVAGKFSDINTISTDASFFLLFDFPLYQGTATNFKPENIIITKDRANILFGEVDAIGKTVTLHMADTSRLLTVIAVMDQMPQNSHLTFDAIIHPNIFQKPLDGGACYVLLHNGLKSKELESKINTDQQMPGLLGPGTEAYHLEPLKESYFNKGNTLAFTKTRNKILIWVGYIVCGLVLFMASFNFINLFLLSLQERKKETGIRKTLGVSFNNLLEACSIEVIIYLVIGLVLSLLLTYALLPVFNTLLEADLAFSHLFQLEVFASIGAVVFLLGILVILISVIGQWNVAPISLMKNGRASRLTFNRFLFTVQFVISITLVICSVTIIRQMNFLEAAPLGFNRNIIQLNSFGKESSQSFPALKQSLLQIPGIDHASLASGNPISGNQLVRYELKNGELFTPYLFSGDGDFIKTLNLTLIEGSLSKRTPGKLVNERLVKKFNMMHPIGETIPGTEDKITGVVKDFTVVSFKQDVPPVIISYSEEGKHLLLDFSGHGMSEVLPKIQSAWSSIFPAQPFVYQILQQDLARKYKEDTFFYKIVIAFAMASMVISCFGLFALSWAVTQSRTKEIGIRKVLGATTKDILNLLTKTFTGRIAIAFLIAAPTGYWLMEKWLSNFANRPPLTGWIFVYSAGLVLIIAAATLFLQTFKAAVSNPIHELRND